MIEIRYGGSVIAFPRGFIVREGGSGPLDFEVEWAWREMCRLKQRQNPPDSAVCFPATLVGEKDLL